MQGKKICSICGGMHERGDLREFAGQMLCLECLEGNTVVCQDCGQRIWIGENAGSDDHPLCRNCFDRDYVTCAHCGRLIRENSACYDDEDEAGDYPYCSVCYMRHRSERAIHDYYYKPAPQFCGKGPRYFGVELEIDCAGESNANAGRILEVANWQAENVYIKHDGSLDDGSSTPTGNRR